MLTHGLVAALYRYLANIHAGCGFWTRRTSHVPAMSFGRVTRAYAPDGCIRLTPKETPVLYHYFFSTAVFSICRSDSIQTSPLFQ
eukprot:scaffold2308_cov164-Ochromonas_danica.AAC.2